MQSELCRRKNMEGVYAEGKKMYPVRTEGQFPPKSTQIEGQSFPEDKERKAERVCKSPFLAEQETAYAV